jgi:ABC-type branched-subunit amino acid transport system substrate-binding protein
LQALDDGYEGKRALANVQELISDRKVFAIIGDVGTPTTKEALPYVVGKKTLFFGAYTGTGILRRDPPDRYVFNYRASYEDETAKMVNYLVDVKKLTDHGIVVFAQNDSYGDAGYDGATKALRKKGRGDDVLRVGYERNTSDVDDAVNKLAEYHNAVVRLNNGDVVRQRHPVKAIIMVGTYKASAKFTQVVPHFDSGATGIIRYRDALAKYHPDQQPDFVSLEGYIVGELFIEGLRRAGRDVDTEKLIDTFEQIQNHDPGTGGSLSFSMSQHQASRKVWDTVLDAQGTFKPLEME